MEQLGWVVGGAGGLDSRWSRWMDGRWMGGMCMGWVCGWVVGGWVVSGWNG